MIIPYIEQYTIDRLSFEEIKISTRYLLAAELIPKVMVKFTKTQKLKDLAARLAIDLNKKVPLQELLDICIELALENYHQVADALREEETTLTSEKIKAIRALAVCFEENSKGTIDDDVYY
ncbi:MAG TPA: hypothetical protein VKM55_15280 [Candidatus Lokiarchaeia archaeon]|nr:hypothetical protein [Candidatus Lokiarchaeia archaeon]